MIRWLDHVNLRTGDVERMVRFYVDVVGLVPGPRPAFDFTGAWLYAGDRPVVHLVGEPGTVSGASPGQRPSLEHFAFAADDLAGFIARLDAHGIAYRRALQVGGARFLVDLRDPDGNRLHVDFDATTGSPPG
jgi:catechol 2,3-dioxygenase-like lactoylglutathione lyase family enzyme